MYKGAVHPNLVVVEHTEILSKAGALIEVNGLK